MAQIRKLEVLSFRCIRSLSWLPTPGINCLIGPGDSGKSTILDAIDLCMGAMRTIQLTDADFTDLAVDVPIEINITLGALSDRLRPSTPTAFFCAASMPQAEKLRTSRRPVSKQFCASGRRWVRISSRSGH